MPVTTTISRKVDVIRRTVTAPTLKWAFLCAEGYHGSLQCAAKANKMPELDDSGSSKGKCVDQYSTLRGARFPQPVPSRSSGEHPKCRAAVTFRFPQPQFRLLRSPH